MRVSEQNRDKVFNVQSRHVDGGGKRFGSVYGRYGVAFAVFIHRNSAGTWEVETAEGYVAYGKTARQAWARFRGVEERVTSMRLKRDGRRVTN